MLNALIRFLRQGQGQSQRKIIKVIQGHRDFPLIALQNNEEVI